MPFFVMHNSCEGEEGQISYEYADEPDGRQRFT